MSSYNYTRNPKAYDKSIANGSTYLGANLVTFAKPCTCINVVNRDAANKVSCRINKDAACTFTLNPGDAFDFDSTDGVLVNFIDFANSSGSNVNVLILTGEDT